MKSFISTLFAIGAILLAGCSKEGSVVSSVDRSSESSYTALSSAASSSSSPASNNGQGSSGQQSQPGVITAGEWNDLAEWPFWKKIINDEKYAEIPAYWGFFTNHRISVHLTDAGSDPVIDATVRLQKDGTTIFTTRTDNRGNAELWISLFQKKGNIDLSHFRININNGQKIISGIKYYEQGINNIVMSARNSSPDKVNISFVVDATGSMGDELEYLKTELYDVIKRAKEDNLNAKLSLSAVFYRDKGDDYLTRASDFSNDIAKTINFIKDQNANGGGDFPEAVHTALNTAINQLHWSVSARARILFLLLDAPPHYTPEILKSIQNSILKANEKGIKIIPITASGINKKTEFLMRFFAISTNGTYVFITDDSGIGNEHLKPTVGKYKVEYLNNLMVRLINKYAR